MSTIEQLEKAITGLAPGDVQKVADWLFEHYPDAAKSLRLAGMRQARGMWKDRDDLPDFDALRKE